MSIFHGDPTACPTCGRKLGLWRLAGADADDYTDVDRARDDVLSEAAAEVAAAREAVRRHDVAAMIRHAGAACGYLYRLRWPERTGDPAPPLGSADSERR